MAYLSNRSLHQLMTTGGFGSRSQMCDDFTEKSLPAVHAICIDALLTLHRYFHGAVVTISL